MKINRNILVIVILAGISVAQTSIAPHFINPARLPHLSLVLLVAWMMLSNFDKLWKVFIVGGLLLDIFYYQPLGLNALLLLTALLCVDQMIKKNLFLLDHKITGLIVASIFVIFATIAYTAAARTATSFLEQTSVFINYKDLAYQGIYSAIFFLVLYFPLARLEKYIAFYDKTIKSPLS